MKHIWMTLGLAIALALTGLTGCGVQKNKTEMATMVSASIDDEAIPREAAAVDLTDATVITMSGTTAAVEGNGATANGGVVTVTDGGTYLIEGILTEGRILVNARGEEVTLVLGGADITCSTGSPIYIYKASAATVHLLEGTENRLTDGVSYTFDDTYSTETDDEPNACLYSKADLIIEGAGSLTVEGNYNNGITCKDTLAIYDGVIAVTAANHGVNGKDSNTINSATLTVTCGGDALRSTNDTDTSLGWVRVLDSVLNLIAGEDGIQAETDVTITRGQYTIVSGGGSTVSSGEVSAKGIKAGGNLTLESGVYVLDCSDDAVHANGSVTVNGGVYTVSSGDDAFHADETLTVAGGSVDILTCYEGLEGTDVAVSGGDVHIISDDDGVNATGGNNGSVFNGHGGGKEFALSGENHGITLSGGNLSIRAGGDGLDANGSVIMTGGTVQVYSSGNDDGALDYDSGFTLSGGMLLAAGRGNMAQSVTEAEQYTVFLNFGTTLDEGTFIELSGNSNSIVLQLPGASSNLVFSSSELTAGTWTVSTGGDYTDGVYSGGSVLTELTITDFITGNAQTGGMGGGMQGGNRGGGRTLNGILPEGQSPTRPEDSMMPENGTATGDGKTPPNMTEGEKAPSFK